jgi:hypothetical protein
MASVTALIPAAFGVVLMLLGLYGKSEGRRRTAMHIAMGAALAGIVGSIGGLVPAVQWLSGSEIARPAAAVSRSLMAITLVIYLAMGIRSFIAARANRRA